MHTYLVQVRHSIVGRRGKRQIDIRELTHPRHHSSNSWHHKKWTHKWITNLPSKFLPQELNDSLESIGSCYFVKVLLHDWSVPDCLEAHNNCSLQHQES